MPSRKGPQRVFRDTQPGQNFVRIFVFDVITRRNPNQVLLGTLLRPGQVLFHRPGVIEKSDQRSATNGPRVHRPGVIIESFLLELVEGVVLVYDGFAYAVQLRALTPRARIRRQSAELHSVLQCGQRAGRKVAGR